MSVPVARRPFVRLLVGRRGAFRSVVPLAAALFLVGFAGFVGARELGLLPGALVPGLVATVLLMSLPATASAYRGGGLFASLVLGTAAGAGVRVGVSTGPAGGDFATALGVSVAYGFAVGTVGFLAGAALRGSVGREARGR
ncbi:hypothetical protein [Halegenticoccus soli]|uniref:hypothetical protein n=1 Tax=Halegenticoccus soli TaxID=1985678 RepID=UPI000C6CC4AD|nr:hypothetical protein [Halegenticoccus soli]